MRTEQSGVTALAVASAPVLMCHGSLFASEKRRFRWTSSTHSKTWRNSPAPCTSKCRISDLLHLPWYRHLGSNGFQPGIEALAQLAPLVRQGHGQVVGLAQVIVELVKLFAIVLVKADQLPVADLGDAVGRNIG